MHPGVGEAGMGGDLEVDGDEHHHLLGSAISTTKYQGHEGTHSSLSTCLEPKIDIRSDHVSIEHQSEWENWFLGPEALNQDEYLETDERCGE